MRNWRNLKLMAAALASVLLSACGGGAGFGDTGGTGSSTGSSTGSTTGSTTGTTTTPLIKLGTLIAGTFTVGKIAISNGAAVGAPLDPGGNSGIEVDLVDTANANKLVTDPVIVTFSSPCTAAGTATIDSPKTNTTGAVTATYSALGCSGDDLITATAAVGGSNLVASSVITVKPAPPSAIRFISATPSTIGLKGAGRPETSVVVFQVVNTAGGPVKDQDLVFSLDTTVGGITLSTAKGTTDANGKVQTTVQSGTVHTSVRVSADFKTPISGIPPAVSDSLVISTGLADQDSFSISAGCFNIEGDLIDGVKTNVSIHAADRFNNPVPDGTAISFTSEGGSIGSQCLTSGGVCSVNFTTQAPRTGRANQVPGTDDHRYTVLATAIGEESFIDVNGNGQFDAGESFTNMPEAFLDRDEDGTRQANEEFLDFNKSGSFNAATGKFKGTLCNAGAACDAAKSLHVRASLPIIMSGSTAQIGIGPQSGAAPPTYTISTIDLSNGAVGVKVRVGDSANQVMPGGTTIAAATTFGSISGPTSFVQPCTTQNGPAEYVFVVAPPTPAPTTAGGGTLTVTVTTNGGAGVAGTVTIVSTNVSFTPNVVVTPPPPAGNLGSISFFSATPTTIGIKGTGLPETSTLLFQVLSDTGVPIADQDVTFALNTSVGGITVSPTTGKTDTNGNVQVIVRSGTVHTVVRVTATATDGTSTVSSQSDQLVISTGVPDQNSFSLSATQLNIEGNNFDGVTTTVTARLADRFNNPVPDGTAVAFTTEGGVVQPQCLTSGGACSVDFTSQNPRTAQLSGANNHRYTVLATAVGEESFTDLNGNGTFDAGEPFTDLTEAFLDRDENGSRGAATEEFSDFDSDGNFDGISGNFTGVLCNSSCDAAKTLNVRGSMIIVMSGSSATITMPASLTLTPATGPKTVTVVVADNVGQSLAGGTTVVGSITNSDPAKVNAIAGPSSYIQPDTNFNGGTSYSFVLTPAPDTTPPSAPAQGVFAVTVTTPKGVVSTQSLSIN